MNNDLISRLELKKALQEYKHTHYDDDRPDLEYEYIDIDDLNYAIDNAPTVVVDCKNCDGYEAGYSAGVCDTKRPQGEISPMEIVAGKCPFDANGDCPLRPQGKWILKETDCDDGGNNRYECSNCHYTDIHSDSAEVPYCWHCGAEMKGGADK